MIAALAFSVLAQVPGPIHITAPCTQTMNNVVGAYSKDLAIVAFQLGFTSVNVVTGSQAGIQFKNGVWRPMLGGCSGRNDLWFVGDCWQSVIQLTATNGANKWLVAPGVPTGCHWNTSPNPPTPCQLTAVVGGALCQESTGGAQVNGLMVWKWNGSAYDVVGVTSMPAGVVIDRLHTTVLDGDTAWIKVNPGGGFNPRWESCDLNAMACGSTFAAAPPAGEGRQSGVGGFAYNVNVDYSCPPVDGGPRCFLMTRSDQPTPTRPPAPTASKTPTFTRTVSQPARTATSTPTYNPCPPFCPPSPTPTSLRTRTASFTPVSPTTTPTPVSSARFSIGVTWTKSDGTTGTGTATCISSDSSSGDYSADYWFFSSANRELSIAVLPSACAINGKVWVKAMGATNVAVDISITDHLTGSTWNYHNGQGQLFQTQIDTGAMPCQ